MFTLGVMLVLVSILVLVFLSLTRSKAKESPARDLAPILPLAIPVPLAVPETPAIPSAQTSTAPEPPEGDRWGFVLQNAVWDVLFNIGEPLTAKGVYRWLRRQGISEPFSVRNVQSQLRLLVSNHHTAVAVVPSKIKGRRHRRNRTLYRWWTPFTKAA